MEENQSTATKFSPISAYNNGVDSSRELPAPDVQILTSAGLRIPAHSGILASVSPVLENMIDRPRKHWTSEIVIPILGVPCDAVAALVDFIYSSRCSEEQVEKYGIHLLAMSHVFLIPPLKQRCTKALGERLTTENLVDVLKMARLCDSPHLYLSCMKLASSHFKAVENTEGWKFLQAHDPWLELEILQFIDEAETRKKTTRRHREEQSLYLHLSEAMDCLEHICTEGCTNVGPYDVEPTRNKEPCSKFSTCQGLQLLIKHFKACTRRVNGVCARCNRMWELLRLHSSVCHQHDSCRVPLCRQFKMKTRQEVRGDDAMWRLLAKRVVSAKTMSSLTSLAKRKREDESKETGRYWGQRKFDSH